MTQGILHLLTGSVCRDLGIKRATDHAEEVSPGWSAQAYELLLAYPAGEFMAESARDWAYRLGLPRPPSERAWGAVMLKAQRQGKIVFSRIQQVNNPKAHRANAAVWRKL